jgi:hypothetical protein
MHPLEQSSFLYLFPIVNLSGKVYNSMDKHFIVNVRCDFAIGWPHFSLPSYKVLPLIVTGSEWKWFIWPGCVYKKVKCAVFSQAYLESCMTNHSH